jgi:hypothetical protein
MSPSPTRFGKSQMTNKVQSKFGGGHLEKTKGNILSLDNNCASCSGHNQDVVKLFKLACI